MGQHAQPQDDSYLLFTCHNMFKNHSDPDVLAYIKPILFIYEVKLYFCFVFPWIPLKLKGDVKFVPFTNFPPTTAELSKRPS